MHPAYLIFRQIAAQLLIPLFKVLDVHLLAFLNQRVHYVCLPPLVQLRTQSPVQALPTVVKLVNRLNRLAPGRQLVDNRHIEVAIQGHGQGTGYRRGRHHQHMRRIAVFSPQTGALSHTETMLLVYHDHAQRLKKHRVFQHGMRPDQNPYLAVFQSVQNSLSPLSFHRPRQQFHPYGHPEQQVLESHIMLLRQNLGRRHDTSLKTIVQCNQDAHQSHQCLPAAYIALQQTVHLSPAPHILTNLTNDSFLRSGQLKRQILFIKRMKQLAYTGKHITTVFLTTLTRILYYIQLNIEKLFELQTELRLPQIFRRSRIMHMPERFIQRHQIQRAY